MGRLSTHVLDTTNGKPARGVAIELFAIEGEQRRSRLSPAKLEEQTGWRPATPLAEGLAETIKYYKRCVTR